MRAKKKIPTAPQGRYPLYRPIRDNGFGRWVDVTCGFFMQCCDCGLVHELQFKANEEVRHEETGRAQVLVKLRRVAEGRKRAKQKRPS